MYQKILVPVDFTPKSYYTLETAIQLAKKSTGVIHLMNVIEVPLAVRTIANEYESTAPKGKELLELLMKKSKKNFEKLLSGVDTHGVTINQTTKVDAAPDRIAKIITDSDYDTIVIGGITVPFDEFLQKTHPEKIVELAKAPVLSVRGDTVNYNPTTIVLPTNLNDNYTNVLPVLIKFLELFDSTLHVVYINTPSNFTTTAEFESRLNEFTSQHRFNSKTTYNMYADESIKNGIMNFSKKIDADTIVCFSKHKDKFLKIIRGDITEYLVNHSKIPVLTFNMKTMPAINQ